MRKDRPSRRAWWIRPVAAVGAVAAAIAIDSWASDWLSGPGVGPHIMWVVGALQSIGLYLLLAGVLASFHNRWRLLTGFVSAVLLSTLVLHVLKFAIGRARPRLGEGPLSFAPFSGVDDHDSFPSGHAMAAGTIAGLLGLYFPRARWVFYGLAGLIGIERVANPDRWHYGSDVIAGFCLAGLLIWACHRFLGRGYYSVAGRGTSQVRGVGRARSSS